MIITREKGMRMWGGGSGSTSASGVNGGGGFSLAVTEGEGTGNAYTGFTYESGVLSLIKGEKFVTVDFFNRLFTAYDSDGNAILPNDVTSTINNLKLLVGTWTEEYLSALGKNSEGGGGGGGIELSDVWQSLKTNTDDYANQKINSAHIPDLSGTYATKTWVNQQGFVTSSGVTSVAMTVPTGLAISGSPITSTGTLALTFATGYSIPTTAKQSNWDTAYGWGNHATAGYASASSVTTLQGYFTNGVAKTAAKLNTGTTTYTAWGQTYWSSGVPQSISGNMTSVGSITPSANGNALGTTSARFNIYGTAGNFSGNVSIGGTLGVTGATTLSSTLSVASGITLTTTKKIYFGDTSHYLELNSTGFHFSHGVYSDSFVSALGANSSGGGSGTFDEESMWTALGTTSTAKVIASSHIPNLDASKITSGTLADARIPSLAASKITSGTFAAARIPIATASAVGGIKVGTTLAISDGVLNQKSGIATAGTYKSVTVDTYGRVTAGTNPTTLSGYGITNAYTKTQVDNALDGYLPLSGGTITGILKWKDTNALPETTSPTYMLTIDSFANGGTTKWANLTNVTVGNAATASLLSYSHGNEINFKGGMQASCFFNYRNADTGNEDGDTTAINYRFCNYTRETAYSTVTAGTFVGAFSGNATTATTLQTPRTIWGQSFDGSSNVSGSITGATTITASGRISASSFEGSFVNDGTVFYFGDSQHAIGSGTDAVLWAYGANSLLFYTNGSKRMTINSVGSVGIGTSSPSSKLHVTGNILASGEVTAASDERKKNIISNTKFNVKDIASARSIIYEWNDDRDKDNEKKTHGGSIAQDWLGKADSFLSQDNDGWYSINYGALALCSAITIAREVVKHEDRITLLEKENARLKARVEELEERRMA